MIELTEELLADMEDRLKVTHYDGLVDADELEALIAASRERDELRRSLRGLANQSLIDGHIADCAARSGDPAASQTYACWCFGPRALKVLAETEGE